MSELQRETYREIREKTLRGQELTGNEAYLLARYRHRWPQECGQIDDELRKELANARS